MTYTYTVCIKIEGGRVLDAWVEDQSGFTSSNIVDLGEFCTLAYQHDTERRQCAIDDAAEAKRGAGL